MRLIPIKNNQYVIEITSITASQLMKTISGTFDATGF